jgi:hypothetical protein
VSSDRSRDAVVLWAAQRSLAATYLQWYAVECLAKALVAAAGRRPPTSGQQGHDIGALLDLAGLRRQDLPVDLRRHCANRSVAMRYELEGSKSLEEEYGAATALARRLAARAGRSGKILNHRGRQRR